MIARNGGVRTLSQVSHRLRLADSRGVKNDSRLVPFFASFYFLTRDSRERMKLPSDFLADFGQFRSVSSKNIAIVLCGPAGVENSLLFLETEVVDS